MSEFADSFFSMPLDIQKYQPDLIVPDMYVINSYIITRSKRRGTTTRAQASKLTEDVNNWINRWNVGE